MKNRKAMGTIPGHRVRVGDQRPGLSTPGEGKPATPLVQELGTRYVQPAKPQPQPQSAPSQDSVKPDFRLVRQPADGPAKTLVAQVRLPSEVSRVHAPEPRRV